MIDYIATLLAYLFDQDKKAHPAPKEGKAALQERLKDKGKEDENYG